MLFAEQIYYLNVTFLEYVFNPLKVFWLIYCMYFSR